MRLRDTATLWVATLWFGIAMTVVVMVISAFKISAAQHAKPTPDFLVLRREVPDGLNLDVFVLQHRPTGACYLWVHTTLQQTDRAVCDHYAPQTAEQPR